MPQWKVLLIEAGGDEPTGTQVPSMFLNFLGSSIDWSYNTEPEEMACLGNEGRRCNWPRGKVTYTVNLAVNNSIYSSIYSNDYYYYCNYIIHNSASAAASRRDEPRRSDARFRDFATVNNIARILYIIGIANNAADSRLRL